MFRVGNKLPTLPGCVPHLKGRIYGRNHLKRQKTFFTLAKRGEPYMTPFPLGA